MEPWYKIAIFGKPTFRDRSEEEVAGYRDRKSNGSTGRAGYRRMGTLAETSSQHKSRRFKTAGRCLLRTLTVQNVPPEKSVDRYGRMLATDETNTSGPKSRRSQRSGPCDLRVSAISGESEKSAVQRSPVPRLQAPSRISATGAATNVPAEFAMTLKQGLFSMSRTGRTFNRR